jgi:hypothetical protein
MEIIIGALLAITITIFVEFMRKPKLRIYIADPHDRIYNNSYPASEARFLAVLVKNEPLPCLVRWMTRNTASACHAMISFHHLDGQNVFGRSMAGRWSGTPEPVPGIISIGNQQGFFFDPGKLIGIQRFDIPPGEAERLDVAAKFDQDKKCYGWSNENYFSNPKWKNPSWQLPPNRYLVRILIRSLGERCEVSFRLVADVPRGDFRLEDCLPGDQARD